jgi:hypothetical protein
MAAGFQRIEHRRDRAGSRCVVKAIEPQCYARRSDAHLVVMPSCP